MIHNLLRVVGGTGAMGMVHLDVISFDGTPAHGKSRFGVSSHGKIISKKVRVAYLY